MGIRGNCAAGTPTAAGSGNDSLNSSAPTADAEGATAPEDDAEEEDALARLRALTLSSKSSTHFAAATGSAAWASVNGALSKSVK